MPVGMRPNLKNYNDFKKEIGNVISERPEIVEEMKTLLLGEEKTAVAQKAKKTGFFARLGRNMLRRLINFNRSREFSARFRFIEEQNVGTVQIPLKLANGKKAESAEAVTAQIVSRSYQRNIFKGKNVKPCFNTEEVLILKKKNKVLGKIFIEREKDKVEYIPQTGEYLNKRGCLTIKHIDAISDKYENIYEILTQAAMERAIVSRKIDSGLVYQSPELVNFLTGKRLDQSCLGREHFSATCTPAEHNSQVFSKLADNNGFVFADTPQLLLERIKKDRVDLPELSEKLNRLIAGKK